MNKEEFIDAIIIQSRKSASENTIKSLQKLEYRSPRRKKHTDIEISNVKWFNSLSEEDQKRLELIITDAVDRSIFSFLCVLDGVSACEDISDKGELKFTYEKDGQSITLNDMDTEMLHDIYNSKTLS